MTFLNSFLVNGIPGIQSPLIVDEELVRPRESEVILAQLISGYCGYLIA